eukprot:scaffold69174_cov28-Tisochrysis_lutea.AAC.3
MQPWGKESAREEWSTRRATSTPCAWAPPTMLPVFSGWRREIRSKRWAARRRVGAAAFGGAATRSLLAPTASPCGAAASEAGTSRGPRRLGSSAVHRYWNKWRSQRAPLQPAAPAAAAGGRLEASADWARPCPLQAPSHIGWLIAMPLASCDSSPAALKGEPSGERSAGPNMYGG